MSGSQEASRLVLYIWPGNWNLPSIDPACLAAVLYLQLAIPGQFSISECSNPDLSPAGQLPYLTHSHRIISPLDSIVKYIASRPASEDRSPPNLDVSLSSTEKSQLVAWCAHAESNIGDLLSHMFYSLPANWHGMTASAIANILPIPQRYYVPNRIRDMHRPRLEAAELWNLSGIEQEQDKPKFGEKPKSEGDGDPKDKFKKVFEREKVLEKARFAFDMYARLLSDRQFFFHDRATTLDVYLASYLLLLLDAPFPDPLLQTLLKESYPTLTNHARRIHLQALPTTGSDIPKLSPQTYSLISLIPWPSSRQSRKPKEKTADEIRFQRMRWGWYALALVSTVFYIASSSIKIVRVVEGGSEDEAGDNVIGLESEEEEEEE